MQTTEQTGQGAVVGVDGDNPVFSLQAMSKAGQVLSQGLSGEYPCFLYGCRWEGQQPVDNRVNWGVCRV
jgi:hypothetical protein